MLKFRAPAIMGLKVGEGQWLLLTLWLARTCWLVAAFSSMTTTAMHLHFRGRSTRLGLLVMLSIMSSRLQFTFFLLGEASCLSGEDPLWCNSERCQWPNLYMEVMFSGACDVDDILFEEILKMHINITKGWAHWLEPIMCITTAFIFRHVHTHFYLFFNHSVLFKGIDFWFLCFAWVLFWRDSLFYLFEISELFLFSDVPKDF